MLRLKIPERRQWYSSVSIVNLENVIAGWDMFIIFLFVWLFLGCLKAVNPESACVLGHIKNMSQFEPVQNLIDKTDFK